MTTSSKHLLRIAVLLLALAPAADAQHQTLTATDRWKLQRVGVPVSSPDGSRAAFVVTTNDINENRANADTRGAHPSASVRHDGHPGAPGGS